MQCVLLQLKFFANLNYRKTIKKDGIPNVLIDWTLNMLVELYVSAGKKDVTAAALNEKCKVRKHYCKHSYMSFVKHLSF